MLEQTIFAIDDDKNLHTVAKFLRHADTLRVMEGVQVTMLIGSYDGQLENSYMVQSRHMHHFEDWIKGQESVLLVPGNHRQPCVLKYFDGSREALGPMRQVSKDKATSEFAWTYNPATNNYHIC